MTRPTPRGTSRVTSPANASSGRGTPHGTPHGTPLFTSRPTSSSRPGHHPRPGAHRPSHADHLFGVSSAAALEGDPLCDPGPLAPGQKPSFAKCDPTPEHMRPSKFPEWSETGNPDLVSAAGGRADWETSPPLKPFSLWHQQHVRAVPCVEHTIATNLPATDLETGASTTLSQRYHYYAFEQRLGFAKTYPESTCAADDSVCRACVPGDGDACVGDRRCLRAGEVPIWGYEGSSPGPMLRVETDLKHRLERGDTSTVRVASPVTIVRQTNALPADCAGGALTNDGFECKRAITSTHHHGMTSLPGFDGWADDVIESGQHKDYCYSNDAGARTNWYHDHGIHSTGFNVANGLAAMYPLYVPPKAEEGPHGERVLPRWIDAHCDVTEPGSGNLKARGKEGWCYELPIQLGEARFSNEGGVTAGVTVRQGSCRVDYEVEGNVYKSDVLTVNGVPWPKTRVFAGRKYRLRLLAATISRAYRLALSGGGGCARLIVVGTDTELLPTPVEVSHLDINAGERYQAVIDFGSCVIPDGKQSIAVILRNAADFLNNEDYVFTDRVMKFIVKRPPRRLTDEGQPAVLGNDWDASPTACASCAAGDASEGCETCRAAALDAGPTVGSSPAAPCLLSPDDAHLRREATHLGLRALNVMRGLELDAAGARHSPDELDETRPVRLRVDARFEYKDRSDPTGFSAPAPRCLRQKDGVPEPFTIADRTGGANVATEGQCVTIRTLIFKRTGGRWVINDKTWRSGDRDQIGRVEASPTYGCLEVWRIITGGGGWHHPVHLHLIDGWLIEREDGRADEALAAWPQGRGVFPHEIGSKDVFFAGFNAALTMVFWPSPNRGNYMFHCHNLIHEDDDMLMSFQVYHEPDDTRDADPDARATLADPENAPFDPEFPFKDVTANGEPVIRYGYPKDEGELTHVKGVMNANNYMFEYQRLQAIPKICGLDAEGKAAVVAEIDAVFGPGRVGRAGKHYERDGKIVASGQLNGAAKGDLNLDEQTEPRDTKTVAEATGVAANGATQLTRNVVVDARYFPQN